LVRHIVGRAGERQERSAIRLDPGPRAYRFRRPADRAFRYIRQRRLREAQGKHDDDVLALDSHRLSAKRGTGMFTRLQYATRIAPNASARSMNTRVEVSSP
jgi:hypothetical protein